ncbi:conserved unknown protein [Ectocarpus siliculosus]|uniref:Uncharacterized protein n=1 Tax=Ectocarpus siliculosus TaxID=2880 RepID=D8LEM5_ECTSI|nr:conserved unknown protein [Ectocarpus siliculosus]|eukprot:CBN78588.1 conserved unknown protein [Ectocarpus siliculosus]
MPPTLAEDGQQQRKNSRKIKRLRDASCMRTRETAQDRWGRQRGGRKARWDKWDRQPSAFKSRLRSGNFAAAAAGGGGVGLGGGVVDEDAVLDAAEEAFAFVDAATMKAAAAATAANAVLGSEGTSSDEGVGGGAGAEGDSDAATGVPACSVAVVDGGRVTGGGDVPPEAAAGDGAHTPSPTRRALQRQEESPPSTTTPEPAATAAPAVLDAGGCTDDAVAASPAPATTATVVSTPSSARSIANGVGGSGGSGGGVSGSRSKTVGSGGRRSSLRSPGGLSRAGSKGSGVGGGLGSGSYRGSPPPLHRRLSSPAGVGSGKKGQRQRQVGGSTAVGVGARGLGSAKKKKQASGSDAGRQGRAEEEEVAAATPPPPPSLFESVFKDKLPSLTPRKAPPATPRLSRDSIVHAIFQSLFGKRKVRSGPRERYGGDWDDVDDDDDDEMEADEDEVDESWIKTGINLTLFNSQAVDFACRSTAGADLLHQYVDSNAVFRLVTDLRFEDPRVPSPRLMIIKAVYENCAHLRLLTLRALAHASHDHLMRTRELEDWAARVGVDIAEAAAAAVADGISGRSGAGGGAGGGRARVTGRDQSQTLGELLLFVLQTFPRFFLGMVPVDEAGGQQQGVWHHGDPGATFSGDGSGYGCVEDCGVAAQAAEGCADVGGVDVHAGVCGGNASSSGFVSPSQAWGSNGPGIGSPSSAEITENRRAAGDQEDGPAAAAAADGGDQCKSGCDGCDDNDGASLGEEGGLVGSPGGGGAGAGGGPTARNAASSGGDPAPASERCALAWPSLASGSPSPATGQRQNEEGVGNKQEPPWSPAWATAGVRSIEDVPLEEGAGLAVNRGSCGDGVWGQGMASKDLAWESEAGLGEEVGGDLRTATDGVAGAARALRFTAQEEDVGGDAEVTGDAGNWLASGRECSRESPVASAGAALAGDPFESGAGRLGLDEWPTAQEAKSSTPEKISAVEPVERMDGASVSGSRGDATGGQEAGTQQPLPSATGCTAAGGGGLALELDLPAVALKEATRSLCNLYASHGAPAAGAEAAASADAPERLQPLALAGSTLCQLWPPSSALLLRRLLGTWPAGSARREVAYLRLIAGVACAAPPLGVVCPGSRLPLMLFRRLAKCINSSNTKVAQEAAFLVQADFILMVYLAPDRRLMDLVTNALCANREHWSADVRNASDQTFDLMLDFL